MKTFHEILDEAKATMCGRCGTRHVHPSKGGKCPAVNETVEYDQHFAKQNKEIQTSINSHLRRGADYPTAALRAGATRLKTKLKVENNNMKKYSTLVEELTDIVEGADVELKRHENGKHYIVHKIHPKSGIKSDQLKTGEKLSDTHVDDLNDMGYKVKIHK